MSRTFLSQHFWPGGDVSAKTPPMYCLFLRVFTLSSVFFTETSPPRPKNAGKKKFCSLFPIYQISRIRQCTILSKSGQKFYVFAKSLPFFGVCVSPDVYVTIKPRFDTAMYRERAEKMQQVLVLGGGASGLAAALAAARAGARVTVLERNAKPGKNCWPPAMAAAIWTTPASRPSGISPRTRPGSSLCWLPSTRPTRWAGLSRSASTPAPTRPGGCTPLQPGGRRACPAGAPSGKIQRPHPLRVHRPLP